MEAQVIIDGYNFIKNASRYRCGWDQILESKERLLNDLTTFRSKRDYSITVVYDGWKNGNAIESYEKIGGIHVIHSRKGETADKVIIKLCGESPGDFFVITADKEIISAVIQNGGQAVNPAEFQRKISPYSTSKMNDDSDDTGQGRAYSTKHSTRKKGPARRPSKVKRRRQNMLEKL